METPFIRSKSLNNIPVRKLNDKRSSFIASCETCSKLANTDVVDGLCKKCATASIVFNRYYESNIPLEYWDLKMDKHFVGDKRLLTKYNELTADMKKIFVDGVSICFAGQHGVGKQLSLDTELPTPNGFSKLIDLKVGDELFDENGNITRILELHPINLSPESYEIEFDDGTKVEACADHLWCTWTRAARLSAANVNKKAEETRILYNDQRYKRILPQVVNTKEIALSLRVGANNIANHSILCAKPINYPTKDLPIDPYVLGCWLGDGNSNNGCIECADEFILEQIKEAGYSINLIKSSIRTNSKSRSYRIGNFIKTGKFKKNVGMLTNQLKQLNLIRNKHIPDIYLYSSIDQRISLLQGLLDTDGTCGKNGRIEFCTTIDKLSSQVYQLITSLGFKTTIRKNESWLYNKRCKDRYRMTFISEEPVFRLPRKLDKLPINKIQKTRNTHRFIVNVKKIEPKPMRCITVDSQSHLFLITKSFIATHNTMSSTNLLKTACQKGYTALYTTLQDILSVLMQAPNDEKFLARKELSMIDFLAIDEVDPRFIANENVADLYARQLESIIRVRRQNRLPTFICTNSPNVVETFSGALKQSLDSILSGYMQIFVVLGPDHRKNA